MGTCRQVQVDRYETCHINSALILLLLFLMNINKRFVSHRLVPTLHTPSSNHQTCPMIPSGWLLPVTTSSIPPTGWTTPAVNHCPPPASSHQHLDGTVTMATFTPPRYLAVCHGDGPVNQVRYQPVYVNYTCLSFCVAVRFMF